MQTVSKKTVLFLVAVGIQLIGLLALGLSYGGIVAEGREVLLKIAPVDPRDPLRGDYVTFQYEISNLDRYLFYGNELISGNTVFVTLLPGKPYWVASGIYVDSEQARQAAGSSGVILKGVIEGSSSMFNDFNQNQRVRLRYGIEQYFIPEGTGRTMDFWNKEMSASVKVDSSGNSILRQLFMNGQPWP